MFLGPTPEWYDSLLEGQAEPGDADRDVFKVFHLRLNRLARPEVVLPRIMRTNFRGLNSASELSCFFEALFGATENGGCKIPLGHSNGVTYSFSPIGAILQLQDKVQDQQKFAELASAAYFYVQKRDISQVSHLPWRGSSVSLPPGYVQNAERTHYIVAVSLCDFSLWIIFDAWDEDWIEAVEGDDVDWIGVDRYETLVKPLRSSTWGRLPGIDGRVQMAKLANNIYSHVYASTAQIAWNIAPEEWNLNEIPVLIPALKTLDGPVTSLTPMSEPKKFTKPAF